MAYIGTSPQNGVRNRFVYAATQGQTAFTGADSDGKTLAISDQLYTDVYQNGVKLKLTTDWTASSTTVTLVNAASVSDVIEILSFDVFSVSDTVPASTGGAFAGAISATSYGAVSGTTGTFSGDVGIGTTVPYTTSNLNVAGATSTSTTAFGPTNPPAAGQLDIRSTDAYSTQRGGKLTLSGNSGTSGAVALSVYGAIQGVKTNATINNAGGGLSFSTTLNANGLLTERMQITEDGRGLSQFTAKAWVNFNGTGTVAIRDSHNVSSITDNGVGMYTVNYSNNFANANYSAVANSNGSAGWTVTDSHAVGSLRTMYYNSGGIDTSEVNVQIFGD